MVEWFAWTLDFYKLFISSSVCSNSSLTIRSEKDYLRKQNTRQIAKIDSCIFNRLTSEYHESKKFKYNSAKVFLFLSHQRGVSTYIYVFASRSVKKILNKLIYTFSSLRDQFTYLEIYWVEFPGCVLGKKFANYANKNKICSKKYSACRSKLIYVTDFRQLNSFIRFSR